MTQMIIEFSRTWKIDLQGNEQQYKEICDGFESIVNKSLYNKLEYFIFKQNFLFNTKRKRR